MIKKNIAMHAIGSIETWEGPLSPFLLLHLKALGRIGEVIIRWGWGGFPGLCGVDPLGVYLGSYKWSP